jgi:hypothetical protein
VSTFPGTPRVVRGGIVLIDPETSAVVRVIVLQYNPDTLNRTLQVQGTGGEGGGDRLEALRLKGPPVETLKLDAEIDAVDQLEFPGENAVTVRFGIAPQLAALETIVYPTSAQVESTNRLAASGTLEIAPMEAPLPLFIWSRTRVLPVRLTEFTIAEEAFDVSLNPIRAKVSLGMRVLSVNDLSFSHKGSGLFMAYHQQKEQLAGMTGGSLSTLGIAGIP